jgi:hypothetical protein
MFNIQIKNNTKYLEVGQINPLRWKTLYRLDGDTFEDQSGWVKCKDFYNDTVAFFKAGSVFSIYGYKNNIKKNDEGVYFLLKFITDKKAFFHNLNTVNTRLFQDLKCSVGAWDQDSDEMVICIPNELWETTYRISMITYVLRLCNYGITYDKWEDLWHSQAPSHQTDHAFSATAIKNAKELGFLVPEKFKDYWYFAGKEYNSVTNNKMTGHIIHNNGVSNWSEYMKQAGCV